MKRKYEYNKKYLGHGGGKWKIKRKLKIRERMKKGLKMKRMKMSLIS